MAETEAYLLGCDRKYPALRCPQPRCQSEVHCRNAQCYDDDAACDRLRHWPAAPTLPSRPFAARHLKTHYEPRNRARSALMDAQRVERLVHMTSCIDLPARHLAARRTREADKLRGGDAVGRGAAE